MGEFPNLENVDVYRYENTFDYSRFKPNARLKLCNVPWCSDYENVVKFADDRARDAWLDGSAGETVDLMTMFNVKPDGSCKVPVPVTSAQGYNYLVVDLPRMTGDDKPIAHASGDRISRYLYFIIDAQQLSPNTTRLVLELDMWSTYINQMRFDYVMLERGHAPVAASPLPAYLSDPRGNSSNLLTADVNTGGEPYIERSMSVRNYSAEGQRACIITACDLTGDLGTASAPRVPALSEPVTSGALAPRVYSVTVEALVPFLRSMEANAPWLKQCVQGVFFAPEALVEQSGYFEIWGFGVTVLNAGQKVERLMKPTARDFAYPEKAARFAKLYTYPYAAIRVGDELGRSSIVRVEDLGASGIEVASAFNLVAPYISIEARLLGIAGAVDSLTFQTLEGRTYSYGGAWGDYLKRWDIPIMQVTQSAASRADYSTVYERAHSRLAADNALASSLASNATAYTNTANTAQNMTANNAVSVAANNEATSTSNSANVDGAGNSTDKLYSDTLADSNASMFATDVQNDTIALSTANNQAAGLARSVGSVVMGAATGGPVGAGVAALGAIVDNVVSIPASNAAAAISQSSNEQLAQIARSNANIKATNSTNYTYKMLQVGNSTAVKLNTIRNNASTSITANNAGLSVTNAGNSKATGDANADRAHATSVDAISANFNQAGVNAPVQFGASANGSALATAPRALFAQIVTQRECDIMNAASAFARYGYSLMREWDMGEMQVMRYFTFWKCSEVWCSGTGDALEGAQNTVRDILLRGVTVWSDPEKIGRVSVFDNFKE